jgi:hypothetical protein
MSCPFELFCLWWGVYFSSWFFLGVVSAYGHSTTVERLHCKNCTRRVVLPLDIPHMSIVLFMVWIWWLWYRSSMGWISMPVLELGYFQVSFEASFLNTCCWGYESHTWLEFIAPSDILLWFRMCAWCIGILCWIEFCDLCSYTTVCISQEMFRSVANHIFELPLLFWVSEDLLDGINIF